MSVDPNTILPSSPQSPINLHTAAPDNGHISSSATQESSGEETFSTAGIWLHRLNVLIFVFLCAVMGVLLIIVPWWPQWTDNYLVAGRPEWRAVLSSAFTRGVCSGLGVLDVWIGFWEAITYREGNRV